MQKTKTKTKSKRVKTANPKKIKRTTRKRIIERGGEMILQDSRGEWRPAPTGWYPPVSITREFSPMMRCPNCGGTTVVRGFGQTADVSLYCPDCRRSYPLKGSRGLGGFSENPGQYGQPYRIDDYERYFVGRE
jgi:hypothetical protein